jgi:hypothetical protein
MTYINHSFFKTVLISFCFLGLLNACKQPLRESLPTSKDTDSNANISLPGNSDNQKIAFTLLPKTGLQRAYSINYVIKIETKSSDPDQEAFLRSINKQNTEVNARLETKVISSKPNGEWKVSFHITALDFMLDGKRLENNNPSLQETTFTVTMNKDGELLNIPENEEAGLMQRNMFAYQNPLLLLPWLLLPRKSVGIGETWSNEFASAIPDTVSTLHPELNLKGNGALKTVTDNQAGIELTFVSELKLDRSNPRPNKWVGKGTMNAVYDFQQGQFIRNKIEMTRETVGFAISDNGKDIKSILTETLQLDLIKK